MTPRPWPQTSLAEAVHAARGRAILDREFDPGEPLTEGELSRRFKVIQPGCTMAIVAPRRAQALIREHLASIDRRKRADGRGPRDG